KLTEAEFIATLRTGHKKGTERPLLPPMPWQNLAGLPEEDLKAMSADLRSLLPIENRVPEPRVPGEAIAAVARSYQRAKDLARWTACACVRGRRRNDIMRANTVVDTNEALAAFEAMLEIRLFEEKVLELHASGRGPGTCTSVGQEASAVGVV